MPDTAEKQNAPSSKPRSAKTYFLIALKIAVSAGIITYLLVKFDINMLWLAVTEAHWIYLLSATAVFGAVLVIGTLRWHLFVSASGLVVSYKHALTVTLIGHFANAFLPGTTGGDVVKVALINKGSKGRVSSAITSVGTDRLLGTLTMLLLACIAMLCLTPERLNLPELSQIKLGTGIFLTGILIAVGFGFYFPFSILPKFLHRIWSRLPGHLFIESLFANFRIYRDKPMLLIRATLLSFASQLMIVTSLWCIALSLRLPASWMDLLVIGPIALVTIAMPISISGHGVREVTFLKLFTLMGIVDTQKDGSSEVAIAFALFYFAVTLIWSILGGIMWIVSRNQGK